MACALARFRGRAGVSPTANLQRLEPVKELAFYDDAGLTDFSNLIVYYEDNRLQEGFGFSSDAAPEPATWALTLAGVSAIGAALRRAGRRSGQTSG